MNNTSLLTAYRNQLQQSHVEQIDNITQINSLIKGSHVSVKAGRYKGKMAIVKNYHFDGGHEYLYIHVNLGHERVREFIEVKDCEFL